MSQFDLFGDKPARKRVQPEADPAARQKAELREAIKAACGRIPQSVRDGFIGHVRDWKKARAEALKAAASRQSSVHELTAALSNMERVCK